VLVIVEMMVLMMKTFGTVMAMTAMVVDTPSVGVHNCS